jgi:hypothetical protein
MMSLHASPTGTDTVTGIALTAKLDIDHLDVQFGGLPGNRPAIFGNCLALWRAGMDPFADLPLLQIPLLQTEAVGSEKIDVFKRLGERGNASSDGYLVGYCTGGLLSSVAATSRTEDSGAATCCSITVVKQDAVGLLVYWEALAGHRAASNGDWVGVWESEQFAWNRRGLLCRMPVEDDSHQGRVLAKPLLDAGKRYAVTYATGPAATNLAAVVTFTAS